jgi:hypothetical protein
MTPDTANPVRAVELARLILERLAGGGSYQPSNSELHLLATTVIERTKEPSDWLGNSKPPALEAALADGTHWLAPMEPTEAMIDAGDDKDDFSPGGSCASAETHWTAMRDQYLADSSGPKIENTNGD